MGHTKKKKKKKYLYTVKPMCNDHPWDPSE